MQGAVPSACAPGLIADAAMAAAAVAFAIACCWCCNGGSWQRLKAWAVIAEGV
jgi:hypothetical protein